MKQVAKFAYLSAIDHLWIDHIDHIEGLRESVGLRGYGQKDPLVEFKNEAYALFEGLISRFDEELSHRIFRVGIERRPEIPIEHLETNVDESDKMGLSEEKTSKSKIQKVAKNSEGKKLGRNDPCWCNSGKKWKHCHYPQMG